MRNSSLYLYIQGVISLQPRECPELHKVALGAKKIRAYDEIFEAASWPPDKEPPHELSALVAAVRKKDEPEDPFINAPLALQMDMMFPTYSREQIIDLIFDACNGATESQHTNQQTFDIICACVDPHQ